MGRLALRPALRAYAHAPAAAPAAAFTNTKSVLFDGTDDGYTSDSTILFAAGAARTVSWWAKSGTSWGTQTVWNGGSYYKCNLFGSNLRFLVTGIDTLQTAYSATDWQHFVAVLQADGGMYLYKDGAEADSYESTGSTYGATTNFHFGHLVSGTYAWPGNIDEIAFWIGTALSAAQVTEIYNQGGSETPGDLSDFSGTAPTFWLRCGDDAGDSGGASGALIDQMGNYDFSAVGAPVIEEDVPPT